MLEYLARRRGADGVLIRFHILRRSESGFTKAGIGREAAVSAKPAFEALVDRHSAEIHAYLWRLLQ
ncbi:MAG: hypothetical protein ACRDG5_01940, partial [Anaerolineales bacterium]